MEKSTQIIKLNAIDSTSLYVKRLLQHQRLEDFTTVVAQEQRKGKGQRGTTWQSEAGKNLMFSMLKHFESLPVAHQFSLNICVSQALYDVLKALHIPRISVKWPNDIMSGSSKICGILIENTVKGSSITQSIIGIGLNVNQTSFASLNKVASLHMVTGREFDLDELLYNLRERLMFYLLGIEGKTVAQILSSYEALLFRKGLPSSFTRATGPVFTGCIRGVSSEGHLILELEDGKIQEFGIKEVSLLY